MSKKNSRNSSSPSNHKKDVRPAAGKRAVAGKQQPLSKGIGADAWTAAVFIFVIAVVPLMVRAKVINYIAPRIVNPIVDTGMQVGLFAYQKWISLMIAAVIVTVFLVYKIGLKKYELRASYLNISLVILVILISASVLAADFKSVSLLGIYNQRDGSLLLLAYLGLCLAAANIVCRSWFKRGIDIALLIFIIVNTTIMAVQFTGHDLLQASLIKAILAPPELRSYLVGNVGNTMGNANYISGFAAALFAYFGAGVLLHRHPIHQLTAGVAALAAFVMVLLSLSSSGFVTLVVIIPFLLLAAWRSTDKHRSLTAGGSLLAACLLAFLILNSYNPDIFHETVGLLLPPTTDIQEQAPPPVAVSPPAGEFRLPQPALSAGTGRTYIWSETLKLTAKRPWLGYGYGTLAYYFPQDDINKAANLLYYDRLITKPHSMYAGVAFGLGIPALITLLTLFLLHFFYTGRRLWRLQLDSGQGFPLALFLFFCAFAFQALFNDPVVDAGAVFWILLGVSVSLNEESDQPSPTPAR